MLTRGLAGLIVLAAPAAALELEWPVACTAGQDCFIQQYMDHDAGTGVRDFSCGLATYDGHDGTDIRVRSLADMEKGVDVLAAAGGTVLGTRDGEPDYLVRTDADRAAVADKECGNGVLIAHEGGWQTQYCHMRTGSVVVTKGESVASGQRLGQIGASGLAAFPHLHLTVRREKTAIDPFNGSAITEACSAAPGRDLWSAKADASLAYQPTNVIGFGFAPGTVAIEDVESGATQSLQPDAASAGLVAWMWAINLERGDEIVVTLAGPGGELASNRETLDRHKAQYLLFAGKKRKGEAWPGGEYTAEANVLRGGKVLITQSAVLRF